MVRTSDRAGIGFLIGGGLGLLVITVAAGSSDNEDVANYAFLMGIVCSPITAIVGAIIGLVADAVAEIAGGNNPFVSHKTHEHCCPHLGNPKTCRWCGPDLQAP